MSIPLVDKAIEAAVRLPAKVNVKVTPRAECLGADGFCGETECRKGRNALSAVYSVGGLERGKAEIKGVSSDGVEAWRELSYC